MKKIIVCVLAVLLNGCDQYKLYTLKNNVLEEIDDTITVGHALSTRSICSNINWSSKQDFRDRSVILYRCTLVGYHTPMGSIYDNRIDKEKVRLGPVLEEKEHIVDNFQQQLDQLNQLNKALTDIQDKGLDKQLVVLRKTHSLPIDYSYLFKENMVSSNKLLWSQTNASRKVNNEIVAIEFQIKSIFKNHNVGNEVEKWFNIKSKEQGGNDVFTLTKEKWNALYAEYADKIIQPLDKAREELNSIKDVINKNSIDNAPISITQNVLFSMDTEKPKFISCDFEAFFENGTAKSYIPMNEKQENDSLECLKMAYDYEYNESYVRLFELIIEDQ